MYNHLLNATKNRIIQELRDLFYRHPAYKNLEIYNRFPVNERIQEGIIVRNTSAGRVPLAADNFQGNVYSYVTFANYKNCPSISLEWVREDSNHLANWIYKLDVSNKISNSSPDTINAPLNVTITLDEQMIRSSNDLSYAENIKEVEVFVNNSKVIPVSVNGYLKQIVISIPPVVNPKVEVSYWSRNLAPSGIYQIEIINGDPLISKFNFMVDCVLDKEDILITNALGNETTAQLTNYPIYPGSLKLRENNILMTENIDYYVDENTGIITFNSNGGSTVLTNSTVIASYRIKGISTGPFEIPVANYAHNTAIPGVVLAFGRAVSIKDKHFVIVNKNREITALEYSGKWDMALSLDVYAKDTIKIEEILDLTTSYLNTYRKSDFDAEGLALVDVSLGGESEEVFDDATGDLYYKGSVDYTFLTEWIMHKPLIQTMDGGFSIASTEVVDAKPYFVTGFDFEKIK